MNEVFENELELLRTQAAEGNAEGLEQNNVEVYKWWMLAVLQGDRNAEANMEMISARLTVEERTLAEGLVADWITAFQNRSWK